MLHLLLAINIITKLPTANPIATHAIAVHLKLGYGQINGVEYEITDKDGAVVAYNELKYVSSNALVGNAPLLTLTLACLGLVLYSILLFVKVTLTFVKSLPTLNTLDFALTYYDGYSKLATAPTEVGKYRVEVSLKSNYIDKYQIEGDSRGR